MRPFRSPRVRENFQAALRALIRLPAPCSFPKAALINPVTGDLRPELYAAASAMGIPPEDVRREILDDHT